MNGLTFSRAGWAMWYERKKTRGTHTHIGMSIMDEEKGALHRDPHIHTLLLLRV